VLIKKCLQLIAVYADILNAELLSSNWHWFSLMGTFLPFEIITYAI